MPRFLRSRISHASLMLYSLNVSCTVFLIHWFSFQIAFNLHSLRWRRSRFYIRLGLFVLIFLFCVPYNTYSLYCYLTPNNRPIPANQNAPEVNLSLLLLNTTLNTTDLIGILENAARNKEDIREKCYESIDKVEWILDGSR